ncbi:hypothetical protein ACHAWF_012469 [Thalassiosira exigua]
MGSNPPSEVTIANDSLPPFQTQAAPSERTDLLPRDISQCRWTDSSQSFCCATIGRKRYVRRSNDAVSPVDTVTTRSSSWTVILFGQTIALALSCANAAAAALENEYRIRVPTFQTGLVYFVLSSHLIYLVWRHRTKQKRGDGSARDEGRREQIDGMLHLYLSVNDMEGTDVTINQQPTHYFPFTSLPLHTAWPIYLVIAILDVEANYLAMLSFQHTSLSSSMLLTSLSVLSTVLLRRIFFLRAGYGKMRLLGILLCLAGGCLWLREDFYRDGIAELDRGLANDIVSSQQPEEPQALIFYGDLLALSAASLYGLNDVLAEYFIKANNDRVEYLGMLGMFGSWISFFLQVPLLERDQVKNLIDGCADSAISTRVIFLFLSFIALLTYFYTSVMAFLAMYDSTILNLSLQSCPLWAVVLTMLREKMADGNSWFAMPPAIFFVSLAMILAGMYLYESNSDERNRDTGSSSSITHSTPIHPTP